MQKNVNTIKTLGTLKYQYVKHSRRFKRAPLNKIEIL